MKSASTIRTCSKIMMVVTIIGVFAGGIFFVDIDDDVIILMFVWAVGGFAAVMQNALFQGFADIIDNTYASACKANGVSVDSIKWSESDQVSFQKSSQDDVVEKYNYAKDLLSKGLISQEEYEKMIKKG